MTNIDPINPQSLSRVRDRDGWILAGYCLLSLMISLAIFYGASGPGEAAPSFEFLAL